MSHILIIDDDKMICDLFRREIEHLGHTYSLSYTLEEGLRELSSNIFDVIFLDVNLPDGDGIGALPMIKANPSSPEVIIITGEGEANGAELAIKNGAWDYLTKPLSIQEIDLHLYRALEYREKKVTTRKHFVVNREGIVGSSPQIESCLVQLGNAASTDSNILIMGETGTGKELFAKAIHKNSARAKKNFVVVDCASLPKTLAESILFGHKRGAFTSADKPQEGLLKQADGGTLFLDEVGELPLSIQSSFLRVLQERRFRPIGAVHEIKSNFRLISATNCDINKMVKMNKFRIDLLFRLRTTTIELPPIRTRKMDIKELTIYYISKICERCGISTKGFSKAFIEHLNSYDWPGNVREFVNTIEDAISNAQDDPILYPIHLPITIRIKLARNSVDKNNLGAFKPADKHPKSLTLPPYQRIIEITERQYFLNLISYTKGDIKKACRISALSRSRLYERLKKYNISRQF